MLLTMDPNILQDNQEINIDPEDLQVLQKEAEWTIWRPKGGNFP